MLECLNVHVCVLQMSAVIKGAYPEMSTSPASVTSTLTSVMVIRALVTSSRALHKQFNVFIIGDNKTAKLMC